MFWVLFGCDQQQIGVLCIFRMGEIISVHKETGKGAAVTSYWKNGGQSILTGSGEILTRFEDGNVITSYSIHYTKLYDAMTLVASDVDVG